MYDMATTTFDKEFKLMNSKEANAYAEVMTSNVSPILKKYFKTSLREEKDIRQALKKALK